MLQKYDGKVLLLLNFSEASNIISVENPDCHVLLHFC